MEYNFFNFMREIGFDESQTRIETYRLDGTNNYLIGLNSSGITWAVSLRIPAMGVEYSKFEDEKKRAVNTARFMAKKLSERIKISDNVSFLFDGISRLIPRASVLAFFEYQNTLPPLVEIENITVMKTRKTIRGKYYPDSIDELFNLDQNKKEKIKKYFLQYDGMFFASKGAPASETLYNHFDLAFDAANSLSMLHLKTGLKELISIETVISMAHEYDNILNKFAYSDFTFVSTAQEVFEKYESKWNNNKDQVITHLIRKEIILRTKLGKNILTELLSTLKYHVQGDNNHLCFTHNDPHSENFIVVEYMYTYEQKNHNHVDREFLNSIYKNTSDNISKLSIEYIEDKNTLLYRNYEDSDIGKPYVNIAKRSFMYDLHLIDIDDATGIEVGTMKSYLNDLLVYSVSISNLGLIKGNPIKMEDIISSYYNFFVENKVFN